MNILLLLFMIAGRCRSLVGVHGDWKLCGDEGSSTEVQSWQSTGVSGGLTHVHEWTETGIIQCGNQP